MDKFNLVLRSAGSREESGVQRSHLQDSIASKRNNSEFFRLMECLVEQNKQIIECAKEVALKTSINEGGNNESTEVTESERERPSEQIENKRKSLVSFANQEGNNHEKNEINQRHSEKPSARRKLVRKSLDVARTSRTNRVNSIRVTKTPVNEETNKSSFKIAAGELIEEGKCALPFATKKSPTSKDRIEFNRVVYYIARRFRDHESLTGGSGYYINQTKIQNIGDERFLYGDLFCYNRRYKGCLVRLRFEYNIGKGVYKLYKIGEHNHDFDNIGTCKKWDLALEKGELPKIQVLKSKISDNRVFCRPQEAEVSCENVQILQIKDEPLRD